ncbi:MAG: tungsten cofactor oxidoreductase radical SAM maturase, partial [Anaerolineae bacterium]|nr:tungsten cofactor oxidoreductase radical SAM maturase [Anaerolineae bacterium]
MCIRDRRPDVRKVYVEVTTNCNLHCRTCVRNVWSEQPGDMSDLTFERLISQLEALPQLEEIAFGGYGEPLAHPSLIGYLERVKARGLKVTISTNGTLLDKEVARELVRLAVDNLFVSLDGTAIQTYEYVRCGADLSTVLSNLELLNRIKAERNALFPRLGVEFVVLKRNIADLARLPELARRLQIQRVIVTHVLPHTPEIAAEAAYARDEAAPLPSAVGWPFRSGDWLLWGIIELPRMNWGAERRCRFITSRALVVGRDGAVSPCYALAHSYPYYIFGRHKTVTRYTFGNINETPLAEIWADPNYVRFRAEVRRFNFPSCVDCELRTACDIAASNDGCWGWCPSCADCLWAQGIVRCP